MKKITSDDIIHDCNANSAFRKATFWHLKEKCSVQLQHLIEWSDGCECQYKGVYAFKKTVEDSLSTGIKITSAFFGSEHRKRESDGETGVVKSKLQEHILGKGAVVSNAADIKTYGQSHLCTQSYSIFKHLGQGIKTQQTFEVVNNIQCEQRTEEYYPISGTRVRIQCMETVGDRTKAVFRNLFCFCHACFSGNPADCPNSDVVDSWQSKTFKKGVKGGILFN